VVVGFVSRFFFYVACERIISFGFKVSFMYC
jgi:hypothetical protein